MYALPCTRVRAPIDVSFSTWEPRPMTTSSPSSHRSRTQAWSPTMTPTPSVVPAKTTAPARMALPSPTTRGGGPAPPAPGGPREDGASVTDHERRELAARGRRALAEDGLLADHGVVADDDVRAELDARVD